MGGKKYNQEDWDEWVDLYVNHKLSCREIARETNSKPSAVQKKMKELGLTRNASECQKGKPSGFKGKKSPFKDVPRSEIVKNKIRETKRKQNKSGSGFYKARAEEKDNLYLITVRDGDNIRDRELYKIGRTFETPSRRFGSKCIKIHKILTANHKIIFKVEKLVLKEFRAYSCVATNVSGKTECFSKNLPLDLVISFIDMAISSLADSTGSEGPETTGEV
jgi:hypothetical protein